MLSKYLFMCVWRYLATAISTGDLRIKGGHESGRLEMYVNEQWGTVCDDKFDDTAATVACKQLKFGAGFSLQNNVQEGKGLESVNCSGHESKLIECLHDAFGSKDCTHYVGVRCYYRVNGGWSVWSKWSDCGMNCGQQYRHRKCDNPVPNHGGKYCSGSIIDMRNCSLNDCTKVDGGWGTWLSWGSCSSSCGMGIRYKFRWCSAPVPKFGGAYCSGLPFSHQICNFNECKVDGMWSTWSQWTNCNDSCVDEFQNRSRRCNNPFPKNGGQNCSGPETDIVPCNVNLCSGNTYVRSAKTGFTKFPPYVLVLCILSTVICIAILSLIKRTFCTIYTKDKPPPTVYDDLQNQQQQQQRHSYDNVQYTTEDDTTNVSNSGNDFENRYVTYINVDN